MTMEIIMGVIALAFVILVVFAILALQASRKTKKKVDRVLMELQKTLEIVSDDGLELIHNTNKLTLDLKKKSEALDVLFRPFYSKKEKSHEREGSENVSEMIDCVVDGVRLFKKIKERIENYVKSR